MRTLLLSVTFLLLFTACFDNSRNITKNEKKNEETPPKIVYTPEQLELKSYLDIYLLQLQALDTDSIIEMTYPKLFIPINKTLFKQYMNILVTSTQISIESFDTNITNIGSIHNYSDGKFAQIDYISTIKLNFINPSLYSDELSVRVLNDVLSRKYGKENIDINPQTRTITIIKEEKLLGLKEENQEWKFLGDNPSYREIYPEILPPDLLAKI